MKNNWLDNSKIDLNLDLIKSNNSFIDGNFQSRIEPLLDIQSSLVESVTKLTGFSLPINESKLNIGRMLAPVSESVQLLGANLSSISATALKVDELLKSSIYDFTKSPMASALNTAVDSIKFGQVKLAEILPSIGTLETTKIFETTKQVNQLNSLHSVAIGTLMDSPIYFPLVKEEEKYKKIDAKIDNLEHKIDELKGKNRVLAVSEISESIVNLLEPLDKDIAKIFKGAISTLLSDSEDMVAQVAESLTRVMEYLPYAISGKEKKTTNNRKKEISSILADYLGLSEEKISSNHLIIQQHSYYSTLSTIRHRNDDYQIYENDKMRFKALVIGVESYVYILLTVKS